MKKKYEKIQNSLNIFSELAILYNTCQFIGLSKWKHNEKKEIEELKNLSVEKIIFQLLWMNQ